MDIKNIIDCIEGSPLMDIKGEYTRFEIDSRKVDEKSIFIPLLGENTNGHYYILDALKKTDLSLCEKSYYYSHLEDLKDQNLVLVDNTTKALHKIAKYILDKKKPIVIGITGSVGKTSTKEFLYHALKSKYSVHKNKGNFNNHIGMPLTIFDLKEEDIIVLEMGMNNLKEIELLADTARPNIALITNIGTSHIGMLGSKENIFIAKMEIISYFNKENTLILNNTDEYLKKIHSNEFNVLGIKEEDFSFKDIRLKAGKPSYTVVYKKKEYSVHLNVLGKHQVLNSMLSLRTALLLGVDIKEAIKGLEEYMESSKRLELVEGRKNSLLISDCYNASAESVEAALEILDKYEQKKIAILGDILEIEGFEKETYQSIAESINKIELDYLLTYGKDSKLILESTNKEGKHYTSLDDLQKDLEEILEDSVCLVKGSQGMNMIEIINYGRKQ